CEDLTTDLGDQGMRVRYLHSEIETLDRLEILTALRAGDFDVLVGVNLLREGLDLPEVKLVCILDADKEGFLRSATSLIQQMGRAARNSESRVILYADRVTKGMDQAMSETARRREKQLAHNAAHGITPTTIVKDIRRGIDTELKARRSAKFAAESTDTLVDAEVLVGMLQADMMSAAEDTRFEHAAALRDQMLHVKELLVQHNDDENPLLLKRSEIEALLTKGKQGSPGTRGKGRRL
ncbi:MAG: helicase-related protein, partial [Phycisphaerales bacterium]|nr:helicase-related protein [Phycisphaerales bacterium]